MAKKKAKPAEPAKPAAKRRSRPAKAAKPPRATKQAAKPGKPADAKPGAARAGDQTGNQNGNRVTTAEAVKPAENATPPAGAGNQNGNRVATAEQPPPDVGPTLGRQPGGPNPAGETGQTGVGPTLAGQPADTGPTNLELADPLDRVADLIRPRVEADQRARAGARQASRRRKGRWPRLFIEALSKCGVVEVAARVAGINAGHARRLRASNPKFAAAWKRAIKASADVLEAEARRRAIEGWDEPVFGKGEGKNAGTEQVGTIRKYSDKLLIQLLAGNIGRYRKTREHRHKHRVELVQGDRAGMYDAILARYDTVDALPAPTAGVEQEGTP